MSKVLFTLGLATLALADSEAFGLVALRSGYANHLSSIGVVGDKLAISTDATFSVVITDDGQLKVSSDSYAIVGSDNSITVGTPGSVCFAIKNGYVVYNDDSSFSFNADNDLIQGYGDQTYSVGAYSATGTFVDDFTPANCGAAASSSVAAESSAVTSSASTTSSPTVATTLSVSTTSSVIQNSSSVTSAAISTSSYLEHQGAAARVGGAGGAFFAAVVGAAAILI